MEVRLIDANKILYRQVWERGSLEPTNDAVALMSEVQAMPTINPEDLPIVQQLRRWVQDLDHQLSEWKFWYGPMREREAKELRENQAAVNVMRKHCEKTIAELRKELARVMEEREALMKELAGNCDLCKHYEDCAVNHYSCCGGADWEYRGPQKEE